MYKPGNGTEGDELAVGASQKQGDHLVRKQEQLRTTIGRVVQNDPLAAKRFQDLVGRALAKRSNQEEINE